jgi:hypothetical protein
VLIWAVYLEGKPDTYQGVFVRDKFEKSYRFNTGNFLDDLKQATNLVKGSDVTFYDSIFNYALDSDLDYSEFEDIVYGYKSFNENIVH